MQWERQAAAAEATDRGDLRTAVNPDAQLQQQRKATTGNSRTIGGQSEGAEGDQVRGRDKELSKVQRELLGDKLQGKGWVPRAPGGGGRPKGKARLHEISLVVSREGSPRQPGANREGRCGGGNRKETTPAPTPGPIVPTSKDANTEAHRGGAGRGRRERGSHLQAGHRPDSTPGQSTAGPTQPLRPETRNLPTQLWQLGQGA